MKPLFFGSSDRPLYGVHHRPKASAAKRTGVVLCYPFGQEYMRSHRAFRQLALLAGRAGFHVFRFDYTATGDSAGDAAEFSVAQAIRDTVAAIDELKDGAEVEQVMLIGLRFGGLIAAEAMASRTDVTHVVLWDPVVSGASYVDELLGDAAWRPQPYGDARDGGSGTLGVMGYPLTDAVRAELRAMTLSRDGFARLQQSLILSNDNCSNLQTFAGAVGAPMRHQPIAGRWNEVDNWGSAMIPQAAIQSIVTWMIEVVP